MKVKLINYTKDPVTTMAKAAAVCYDSSPDMNIVKKCIESGHLSIAEFADFHFEISGVSRALTHQLVRHRVASYAQRSQRYVKEDNFDWVTPPSVVLSGLDLEMNIGYNYLMNQIKILYGRLLEAGVPKEDARYILPNATYTTIHVKMNFRELMHFCSLRLCTKAQWEIRKMAEKMREVIAKEVSLFLADCLKPKGMIHGCNEKDPCGFCSST